MLNLIARDQATTDRWAIAEATYQEAIDLARESGQQTELTFGLAGLAWLQARRGREQECRACAAEALDLCHELGTQLHEIWAIAALGDLELGLGDAAGAAGHFEQVQQLLRDLAITDTDLSPAAELVDAYIRLGRNAEAQRVAAQFTAAASAKGQPWSLARALRCRGLLAADAGFSAHFERALGQHEQTPDAFEAARTRLAYGERLRRARNRVLAREQLRAAVDVFERLDARPWADRARTELAATGETRRRRDPSMIDELTPARAADRAPAHSRKDDTGDRGRAVPQPEDRRIPPPPRLPKTRHPLSRRARTNARRANAPNVRTGQPGAQLTRNKH